MLSSPPTWGETTFFTRDRMREDSKEAMIENDEDSDGKLRRIEGQWNVRTYLVVGRRHVGHDTADDWTDCHGLVKRVFK